jgi:4-diphosphocytidyl-2-C-methyl-D-erythritol kinase
MSNSWPAPAKLNLFLHIVGRRDDGYHLLQTAFQFLDYCDYLDIIPTDNNEIKLSRNYDAIDVENDLIMRAARLLQSESGTSHGANIHINKTLPMGGGLGGGSSNAATTLVALNSLWQLGLTGEKLSTLGLSLGADVPVFMLGSAAWAEGVGELLQPIEVPEKWYLVASPDINISTMMIFNAPDLTRDTPAITIRDFLTGKGKNDCESVVRSEYLEVAQLIDWMGEKAPARMTGTGACVFSEFETEDAARLVHDDLPQKWTGFVAKGINKSPLLARLAREYP